MAKPTGPKKNWFLFRQLPQNILIGTASDQIKISMDGKGRWMDNVFIERLWKCVKDEEVYFKGYNSIAEDRRELGVYFEFYNRTRPHQGLDDRTPDEVYWRSRNRNQIAA